MASAKWEPDSERELMDLTNDSDGDNKDNKDLELEELLRYGESLVDGEEGSESLTQEDKNEKQSGTKSPAESNDHVEIVLQERISFEPSPASDLTSRLNQTSSSVISVSPPPRKSPRICNETIELSSDEEEDFLGDENSNHQDLEILTIRPKSKSQLLNPVSTEQGCVEVLEYFQDQQSLKMEERHGYIKEMIDDEGMGIVFSMECGMALFHTENIWIHEEKINSSFDWKEEIRTGQNVSFLNGTYEGEEYSICSSEGLIRQAVAVWIGRRPPHLIKQIQLESYQNQLKLRRRTFLDLIQEKKFLPVQLVRVVGSITGYLNDDYGIIESPNTVENDTKLVMFNTKDLYNFGRNVHSEMQELPYQCVPQGLRVVFDAIRRPSFRGINYQACAVFAGSWPRTPHPTSLPGAVGPTKSNCYTIQDDHSHFYLDLQLPAIMNRDWGIFQRYVNRYGNEMIRSSYSINNGLDYGEWRRYYCPFDPSQRRRNRNNTGEKKRNFHEFTKFAPKSEGKFIKSEQVFIKSETPNLESIPRIKSELKAE